MPDLLAEAFAAAGAEMADHLDLRPVDPMYRAVYADGSVLHVRHGGQAMTEEIRGFAGPEAAGVVRALRRLGHRAVPGRDAQLHRRPVRLRPRPRPALARRRAGSLRLGGFGRLGRRVASFFDDERLQRVFGFQSMYAGVAPYEALALYAVITYMDSIAGVFVAGRRDARHVHRARRRRRQGRGDDPLRVTGDERSCATHPVRCAGVELAGGERLGRRRRRLQRRPARRLPHAARRRRRAACRPPRALLAVVPALGRRRARWAARRRRPPQHPLRPAVGRVVPRPDRRRAS